MHACVCMHVCVHVCVQVFSRLGAKPELLEADDRAQVFRVSPGSAECVRYGSSLPPLIPSLLPSMAFPLLPSLYLTSLCSSVLCRLHGPACCQHQQQLTSQAYLQHTTCHVYREGVHEELVHLLLVFPQGTAPHTCLLHMSLCLILVVCCFVCLLLVSVCT